MSESKAVVNWEEELSKAAKVASQSERPKLAAISLRGGIMMYEKVQVPGNKLRCIIVASNMQRLFYKERFDPNKAASPVCFSFHDGTDDVPWVPHEKSHDKQADSCMVCPRNEWGSDLGGGKGKACKETRKLAVIPGAASKEMALVSVPVTSVRNWANFVNGVAASAKRPPWGVWTEISLHPHVKNQFEVRFEPVDLVSEEELPGVYSKRDLAMEALTVPYDYQNPQDTMAAQGPAKAKKY